MTLKKNRFKIELINKLKISLKYLIKNVITNINYKIE